MVSTRGRLVLPLVLAGLLGLAPTGTAAPPPVEDFGRSASDLALEEVLRTGEVVGVEDLDCGVTRPQRLTLRHGQTVVRAVFKTVDFETDQLSRSTRWEHHFRDSFLFEVAAYRVDRLLGLNMVPVTVLREVDGRPGSVQAWVEGATTLERAVAEGVNPRNPELVPTQFMSMYLLDALIDNVDRNLGNILVRPDRDEVFLIDHSRAFRCRRRLTTCDMYRRDVPVPAPLALRLRTLNTRRLQSALGDLLTREQISSLLKRHELLLQELAAGGLLPPMEAVVGRGSGRPTLIPVNEAPER